MTDKTYYKNGYWFAYAWSKFQDNVIRGKGKTEQEAIQNSIDNTLKDGYCIANHPYYQAIKDAKNFALRDLPPSIRAEIRIRHEYE